MQSQNSFAWCGWWKGIPCRILHLKTLLFQAQVPGHENPAVSQGSKELPKKNTAPTSSPSVTAPRGFIQHLPDLDAEKPDNSKGEKPEEAFPVQLDLTTNPQGDTLDLSFLYLEPGEKKLVVLPFPGKEQRSAECPGPERESNTMILPPWDSLTGFCSGMAPTTRWEVVGTGKDTDDQM